MKIKPILAALALSGAIALPASNAHASGIPTVDVAAIAQNLMAYTADVAHYAEVLGQWKQQYEQMTAQLNQLKQQYEAITGARGMADLLKRIDLYQSLPPEWQEVYKNVEDAGEALEGIKALHKGQKQYFGTINTSLDGLKKTYKAATNRIAHLETLMAAIDQAVDAKAAADLANRISVEQALIQNESSRIALMVQMQEMQMKVAEEQRHDDFLKRNSFYKENQ